MTAPLVPERSAGCPPLPVNLKMTLVEPLITSLSVIGWMAARPYCRTSAPSRLAGQNVLVNVDGSYWSDVERWICSKLQFWSHPSRFSVLPSSHCSLPLTLPSPHTMSWQFESHVPAWGGSQVSGATTHPSPQVLGLQTWFSHTPPLVPAVVHGLHDERTVPAAHF